MNNISSSISGYLHTYEAYRVPKGTKVQNADGEEVVLSNDEDTLVLTEESSRQLIKDRKGFVELLDKNADLAAQKTQEAASKKIAQDQAKALAVFRSMSSGDIVPATDESKLMEYDKKLYQAAKMAQAMAQMEKKKTESKESKWDEREENEYRQKQKELCDASNEAALGIGTEYHKFYEAQKANIVEIESENMDFSTLKTLNYGGVTGTWVDLTI